MRSCSHRSQRTYRKLPCQGIKKSGSQVKALVHNFRNDLDEFGVEIIPGNLLDNESLMRLSEGADVVFHLAAHTP